jgi:hypothetical protein
VGIGVLLALCSAPKTSVAKVDCARRTGPAKARMSGLKANQINVFMRQRMRYKGVWGIDSIIET